MDPNDEGPIPREIRQLRARVAELEALLRDLWMICPDQPGRGDLSREQRTVNDLRRWVDANHQA